MKTIWKQRLQIGGVQAFSIPVGAEIVSLQVQENVPCLWYLCDPNQEREVAIVAVYGNWMARADKSGRFVGTFQIAGGALVFHVFEEPRQPLAAKS